MVDSAYPQFFRPLTLKRRRLIAACIRAFYARLYGSHADYRSILGRENLRDLFVQTMQSATLLADPAEEDGEDGFTAGDLADDQKLASAIVRLLVADGWLETAEDRVYPTCRTLGPYPWHRFTTVRTRFCAWPVDPMASR